MGCSRASWSLSVLLISAVLAAWAPANAQTEPQALTPRAYLPMVANPAKNTQPPPPTDPNNWLSWVNYYRALAGVPAVTENTTYNQNCYEHARYMAEMDDLGHDQNKGGQYATPGGLICAQNGNAWMGWGGTWSVRNTIEGWMGSVGHRLWLIYPTTPTFGYGFYRMANGSRSGAALDVLSKKASDSVDKAYPGWPVRYPNSGQNSITTKDMPITLMWRYFGPAPTDVATSLRIKNGAAIAHTFSTNLTVGHKGVSITPNAALPNNTVFVVTVTGKYNNINFSYSWEFATGTAVAQVAEEQAAFSLGEGPFAPDMPQE